MKHPEGTEYHKVRSHNDTDAHVYLKKAGYAAGGAVNKDVGDFDDGEPDMMPGTPDPIPQTKPPAPKRPGKKDGGEVAEKKMVKKAVHKHEKHDHPGKPLTKLKDGGHVEGRKAKARMDKFARGGEAKHKGGGKGTKVNVIVAPGGGGAGGPSGADPKEAFKAGMMTGVKAAAAKMGGAGGPPPAGGAPGMAPPPPGGAPGGPMPPMAKGGRAYKAPHMTGGSESGIGRLEKTKLAKKEFQGKQ